MLKSIFLPFTVFFLLSQNVIGANPIDVLKERGWFVSPGEEEKATKALKEGIESFSFRESSLKFPYIACDFPASGGENPELNKVLFRIDGENIILQEMLNNKPQDIKGKSYPHMEALLENEIFNKRTPLPLDYIKAKGWYAANKEQEEVAHKEKKGFYFRNSSFGPNYLSAIILDPKEKQGEVKILLKIKNNKIYTQNIDNKNIPHDAEEYDSLLKMLRTLKKFKYKKGIQIHSNLLANIEQKEFEEGGPYCPAPFSFIDTCNTFEAQTNTKDYLKILSFLDDQLFPTCQYYLFSRVKNANKFPALIFNSKEFSLCIEVNQQIGCKRLEFNDEDNKIKDLILDYLGNLNRLCHQNNDKAIPFKKIDCLFIDSYFQSKKAGLSPALAKTWQDFHPDKNFDLTKEKNFVYAENHADPTIRKKLWHDLKSLRKDGVKTLGLEFLYPEDQEALDLFMKTGDEKILDKLQAKLKDDLKKYRKEYYLKSPNLIDLIRRAREVGFEKIVSLDHSSVKELGADDSYGLTTIKYQEDSSRVRLQNAHAAIRLAKEAAAGGIVVLEGAAHGRGLIEILGAKKAVFTKTKPSYSNEVKMKEIDFSKGEKLLEY